MNEENDVEPPVSEETIMDENLLEEVEEAAAVSELEKFEINTEDDQSVPVKGNDDLEITEIELVVSDDSPVEESESILKNSIDEENVLASLTEEFEKDKNADDEIIILDEKEQEDLLNFYDNELEISIDDEF